MNVFYLDSDPVVAAKYACDKHVVKMIVETAQLLSTACRDRGIDNPDLYKVTHLNHPSAVWVRATQGNYRWAVEYFNALCVEYTARYRKIHKCQAKAGLFDGFRCHMPAGPFSEPPRCMPDECMIDGVVESYRKYYIEKKAYFAKWKYTETPSWFLL